MNTDMLLAQGIQRITSKKLGGMIQQDDPDDVDVTELRQLTMAYDTSRSWMTELIGFLDDEMRPLDELAKSDEALAERLKDDKK